MSTEAEEAERRALAALLVGDESGQSDDRLALPPEGDDGLGDVVTGAEQLANARKAKAASEPLTQTLAEILPRALERMRARAAGKERRLPIPWSGIARVIGGDRVDRSTAAGREVLRPGVHVLVGGTGSGKTQFALSLALEAAKAGRAVTYIGLELDEVGLMARLMALEWARGRALDSMPPDWSERWSSIDWSEGDVAREGLERVAAVVVPGLLELVGTMRFRLGGARSGFNVDDVGKVLDEALTDSAQERPGLVVVDFLQLLGARPGIPDDREIRTRIAGAAYAANNATTDGRLAVVLVSATAREHYDKLEGLDLVKLPGAQSLVGTGKESGEIEYSATTVLVLAKPKPSQVAAPFGALGGIDGWKRARLLAVAKNRHGGAGDGWALLGWDGSAFYDVDPKGDELERARAEPDTTPSGKGTKADATPKPKGFEGYDRKKKP